VCCSVESIVPLVSVLQCLVEIFILIVLQCVAVCCSDLQCVVLVLTKLPLDLYLHHVAVCCSVLQCDAVCCPSVSKISLDLYLDHFTCIDPMNLHIYIFIVLQCDAACCGALQFSAMCCFSIFPNFVLTFVFVTLHGSINGLMFLSPVSPHVQTQILVKMPMTTSAMSLATQTNAL